LRKRPSAQVDGTERRKQADRDVTNLTTRFDMAARSMPTLAARKTAVLVPSGADFCGGKQLVV
jgi:hypothetical protein